MDEDGQHGAEQDDQTEDEKLLDVADDDGIDDLGAHLEFQTQGQGAAQLDHDVDGLLGAQADEQLDQGAEGTDDDDEDPDELQGEDRDLGQKMQDGLVVINNGVKREHRAPPSDVWYTVSL